MKSKELIEILSKHPEFDVEFGILEPDGSSYGLGLRVFSVVVDDIGCSSGIIRLGPVEEL